MLTQRRLSRMDGAKLSMAEALQWLCRAEPSSKDLLEALQTWTAKTPARVALTQARSILLVNCLWGNLFWEPGPSHSQAQCLLAANVPFLRAA